MAADREIKGILTLDGAEWRSELARAKRDLRSFDRHVQDTVRNIAIAAAGAMTGIMIASVKAAAEAQRAQRLLEQAVRSTGGTARLTVNELIAMSAELQAATTHQDDAIQRAQARLLSFTGIQREEFKGALQAALDLSVALDQDLQTSIVQIGKALNDPIRGMTALTRVGISFTESQREVIRSLSETGQVAKAQQFILAELRKEFGGQAAVDAATFSGRLKQLRNVLNDIGESIGGLLLPRLTQWITQLKTWALAHQVEIVGFFRRTFEGIARIIDAIGGVIGYMRRHWDTIVVGVTVIGSLMATVMAYTAVVRGAALATAAWQLASGFLLANPWVLVITAIVTAIVLLVRHLGGWKTIWIQTVGACQLALEWLRTAIRYVWEDIKYIGRIFGAVGNTVKVVIGAMWDAIKEFGGKIAEVFGALGDIITEPWRAGEILSSLKDSLGQTIDTMRDAISTRVTGIWDKLSTEHATEMAMIRDQHAAAVVQIRANTQTALAEARRGMAEAGAGEVLIPDDAAAYAAEHKDIVAQVQDQYEQIADAASIEDIVTQTQHQYEQMANAASAAYSRMGAEVTAYTKVVSINSLKQIQYGRLLGRGARDAVAEYIEAKGKKHAFDAISDAVDALSAFAHGNIAQGIALSLSSVKHGLLAGGAQIAAGFLRAGEMHGQGGGSSGEVSAISAERRRDRDTRSTAHLVSSGPGAQIRDINLTQIFHGPVLLSPGGVDELGEMLVDFMREAHLAGRLG